MIQDYELLKSRLKEFAEIVNLFKSEAVQLRLAELFFETAFVGSPQPVGATTPVVTTTPKLTQKSKRKTAPTNATGSKVTAERKKSSGAGAVSTLVKLHTDNFFAKPQSIRSILDHCETNLARRIRPNEISGKLARMVRSRDLKRSKNDDGQYEYVNP